MAELSSSSTPGPAAVKATTLWEVPNRPCFATFAVAVEVSPSSLHTIEGRSELRREVIRQTDLLLVAIAHAAASAHRRPATVVHHPESVRPTLTVVPDLPVCHGCETNPVGGTPWCVLHFAARPGCRNHFQRAAPKCIACRFTLRQKAA